jgi:hypothetical protein
MCEIVQQKAELEKEIARLNGVAREGERAIEEKARLRSKLASAESALNAASRVAEQERNERGIGEEQLDQVLAAVREASEGESRLDLLVKKLFAQLTAHGSGRAVLSHDAKWRSTGARHWISSDSFASLS